MTIYSLYLLSSLLLCGFTLLEVLRKGFSARDKAFFTGLVFFSAGIVSVGLLVELMGRPSKAIETANALFLPLVTGALYGFFLLGISQGDFNRAHRKWVWLFSMAVAVVAGGWAFTFLGIGLPEAWISLFSPFVGLTLFGMVFVSLSILYRKYHLYAELEQARLSAFFMNGLIMSLVVITDVFYLNSPGYRLICFATPIFLWTQGQLLIKKRIIVIERVLKVFILKITCLVSYLYVYVFLKKNLFAVFIDQEPGAAFFFTGFLFASFITYPSAERFFEQILNKVLFRPLVNYHLLFRSFSNVILTMVDVDKIADMAAKMFYDAYGIEQVSLFMYHADSHLYQLKSAIGTSVPMKVLPEDHPFIRYIKKRPHVVRKREVASMDEKSSVALFDSLKAEICIPLETKKLLLGVLFLGVKTNGAAYAEEDMEIFTMMEGQVSVALNNALFFQTERESFELMAQRNKMEAVIALSGGINHEINNPLSIISMKSQNFLRKMSQNRFTSQDEALKNAVEVVESNLKNAGRAHMITQRLGNFAKPTRDVSDVEDLQVKACIEDCVELAGRTQFKNDNIEIVIEVPQDLPTIRCDRSHFQQVIFNLVMNAYHAIGQNGHIVIRAEVKDAKEVCLRVQDDGCGIKSEEIEKIWQPFFTTKPKKPSPENKFTGSGLGLALVRRYVEHSGGRIAVESEEGKGTTFLLYFKRSDTA